MASIDDLPENTQKELAEIALRLSGNKATRKPFLSLLKKVSPDTPIPEIDEPAAIEERLEAEKKAREEWQSKIDQERREEKFNKQRDEARNKYGLNDEQFKQMEEMMTKGELPADYNWAPQLFRQQIEPVGATYSSGNSGWGPFEIPAAEGLMENEQSWSVKTAHQIIDDMQNKRTKPF